MKKLTVELQLAITGEQDVAASLTNAEDYWNGVIGG